MQRPERLIKSHAKRLREPIEILTWLRDHAHHSGAAMEQGLELSGDGGRVVIIRETMQLMQGLYGVDPLVGTRAKGDERMYVPTVEGHKLLTAAAVGVTFERHPTRQQWCARYGDWRSHYRTSLLSLANSRNLPLTWAEAERLKFQVALGLSSTHVLDDEDLERSLALSRGLPPAELETVKQQLRELYAAPALFTGDDFEIGSALDLWDNVRHHLVHSDPTRYPNQSRDPADVLDDEQNDELVG